MTTNKDPYAATVSAVKAYRNGSDSWGVADALLSEVPQGAPRRIFAVIAEATRGAGVSPLSVSSMRQYRDCAAAFPPDRRNPDLSFSAHRYAIPADDPEGLLKALVAQHGAAGVTVPIVKAAIGVQAGRLMPAPKAKAGGLTLSGADPVALIYALTSRAFAEVEAAILADPGVLGRGPELERISALLRASGKAQGAKAKAWGAAPKASAPKAPKAKASAPVLAAPKAPRPGGLKGL